MKRFVAVTFGLAIMFAISVSIVCAQSGQGGILPHVPLIQGKWSLEIQLLNQSSVRDAVGIVTLFSRYGGSSGFMKAEIKDNKTLITDFQYPYRLQPLETRIVSLRDSGSGQTGWMQAVGDSSTLIKVYWVKDEGDKEIKYRTPLVSLASNTGYAGANNYTALALVNTSFPDSPVSVKVSAVNEKGIVDQTFITLEFGETKAAFLWQMLPGLPADFSGSIAVEAKEHIAFTARNF